jgi:hypothetical protein
MLSGVKHFIVIMPDCNVQATIAALMVSFFGNADQTMPIGGQSSYRWR